MDKIIIMSSCIVEDWKTGSKSIKKLDKDDNRYYKKINGDKWVCIPSLNMIEENGYKEGYGLSIEEAYCDMEKSFNIPLRLTMK